MVYSGASARAHKRLQHSSRATCSPYTNPLSTSTLSVYSPLTITWDSTCLSLGSSVDLYLSVVEATGTQAVHEWTDVSWAAGKLETELKPSWWNASTGAGEVQAQFIFVPSGNAIWDTAAPVGPLFTIAYNGSYPSETSSAILGNYTGPSVESVSSHDKSFDSAKLGPAIAVPLLALAGLVVAYVVWNKLKKKPETKRWSAVVDHRVSMISNGTMAPPRHSMMSQRPGSMASRPGSVWEGGAASMRRSQFGDRPQSYHSIGAGVNAMGQPSPLGGPRPQSTADGRSIGAGERASRISFAQGDGARPSFSSSRKAPSIYSRHSFHAGGAGGPPSPNLPLPPPLPSMSPRKAERLSQVGYFAPHSRYSTVGSVRSGHSGQGMSASGSVGQIGRSGTTEELSNSALAAPRVRTRTGGAGTHRHTKSGLGQEYRNSNAMSLADYPALAYANHTGLLDGGKTSPGAGGPTTPTIDEEDGRPTSPFDDPLPLPPVAIIAPAHDDEESGEEEESHMPSAFGAGLGGMTPDEMMANYAAVQQTKASPSPILPTSPSLGAPLLARAASSASMIKSKSAGLLVGLGQGTGKMMRSLSSKASLRLAPQEGGAQAPIPAGPASPTSPTAPMFAQIISPPPAAVTSSGQGMTGSASTPIADMLARGNLARSASASSPLGTRPPLSPGQAYAKDPFASPVLGSEGSSSSFGEAM